MKYQTKEKPLTLQEFVMLAKNSGSAFFEPETMKFFGDTFSNYVLNREKMVVGGENIEIYRLSRKKPVKHGLQSDAFFQIVPNPVFKTTVKRIYL